MYFSSNSIWEHNARIMIRLPKTKISFCPGKNPRTGSWEATVWGASPNEVLEHVNELRKLGAKSKDSKILPSSSIRFFLWPDLLKGDASRHRSFSQAGEKAFLNYSSKATKFLRNLEFIRLGKENCLRRFYCIKGEFDDEEDCSESL